MSPIIVLCGVSGSGKSSVGKMLAAELGAPFLEGDELHDPASIASMRAGVPLTEDARAPWLARIRHWIDARLAAGNTGVIACSALTHAARSLLRRDGVVLVLLRVPADTLETRVRERHHAFMPASLLQSQLDTFEPPRPDEHVLVVDAAEDVTGTTRAVLARLLTCGT